MDINKLANFFVEYDKKTVRNLKRDYAISIKNVKNEPFYLSYKEIINNIAVLYKDLNIINPFAISIMYEYMLWNGFFSVEKKYQFNNNGLVKNLGILGADIMSGRGVCLNNASMLADILNESNYESYLCGCNLPNGYVIEKPNIKRDYCKPNLFEKIVESFSGLCWGTANHAITLINYDGYWFLSDPTNLCFLNFQHFLSANVYGDKKIIDLDPDFILLTSGISRKHFMNVCLNSYDNEYDLQLEKKDILIYYKQLIKFAKDNVDILNNFYEDNYENITTVTRTLKK